MPIMNRFAEIETCVEVCTICDSRFLLLLVKRHKLSISHWLICVFWVPVLEMKLFAVCFYNCFATYLAQLLHG